MAGKTGATGGTGGGSGGAGGAGATGAPGAPGGAFALPLALTTAPSRADAAAAAARRTRSLVQSFWVAAALLIAWLAALAIRARSGALTLDVRTATPRPQHYVQSLCQFGVYSYWGWFWPPVYDFAPLLLGQLLFAYVFDMLLAWSRREPYQLGFGPFPIVFSTNLFLWFKDDWFFLQFVLIAVGFLGKAFVRWTRDGKRVHIFNPSAFTLAVFSLALLATGTTNLTWGQEINTTFSLGPRIYTVLFAIGLVVMYFFAITPVTAAAAATLFAASALYVAVTGVPYFVDSEIPSAVFLGLHLLVTDPSTSPRTPLGPRDLWRALRSRRRRPLRAPRQPRPADLLRQAAVRSAAQPCRAGHRPRGARAGRAAAARVVSASTGRWGRATSRTWARGSSSSR